MNALMLWFGFIGAWSLFAGAIYQSALELRDQDIERDRIRGIMKTVEQPREVSNLWWFFPPVKIYLERKRSLEYQKKYVSVLSLEDAEALLIFISKSIGWSMVGIGAFFVAVKETHELAEMYHIGILVFWIIVVFIAFACLYNTAVSMKRTEKLISLKK